ncbi:Protein of unknown function [Pyronema omphalodes CBS 100304]|uniref:Uncharacterized protein n=1 Tax=Pyronema omphalodes (strain CBS 100304) TaxID=1076935 RepID=U4KXQ9_PYROM|nr:Protein of unknown function [Pyronema omphalodes CBS 100304]
MKLSINRQNLTIASLENRVAILTLVPEEYDLLRQRFLSKCKQKVGNAVAHGGDAVADSRLYLKSKRLDGEIFRELYGLDVLVVPLLSTEIISVLNLFFFFTICSTSLFNSSWSRNLAKPFSPLAGVS